MSKKRLSTEDHLALLRQVRTCQSSPTPAALESLQQILASPRLHGIVVQSVADLAQKWSAKSLAPALQSAAESLAPDQTDDAPKRDPGCQAKQTILALLIEWDLDLPNFFLHASEWHQHEPVQKGSIDTAAECRGLAAIGIARTRAGGPDIALNRLLDLLADSSPATRARAAQALSLWRGPEAAPLLRLKALLGDDQPEVIGETLAGLLSLEDRGSHLQLDFVSRFLDSGDPKIVEAAALALGESRTSSSPEKNLAALSAAWDRWQKHPVHTSLLMAIALLRHDNAISWLLAKLAAAHGPRAREFLAALAIHRGDPRLVPRLHQLAQTRPDLHPDITQSFP